MITGQRLQEYLETVLVYEILNQCNTLRLKRWSCRSLTRWPWRWWTIRKRRSLSLTTVYGFRHLHLQIDEYLIFEQEKGSTIRAKRMDTEEPGYLGASAGMQCVG